MEGSPFYNIRGARRRSAPERKTKKSRQQNTETYIAPARIALNLGLAFENNRVVEGLGFSSDGSAGRLVGLQAEAGLPQGVRWCAVRLWRCGGFERQCLLIALGYSCFQQQSGLQHSSILVGSAPVPLS